MLFLDPDGRFSFKATGEELEKAGVTDVAGFAEFLLSVGDMVESFGANEDNADVISEISRTTGLGEDRIKEDFKSGEGPQINLKMDVSIEKQNPQEGTMTLSIEPFANLYRANQNKGKEEIDYFKVVSVMYSIHEYGHYGDKETNDGINTGQTGFRNPGDLPQSTVSPKQQRRRAVTGHRGTDIDQVILKLPLKTSGFYEPIYRGASAGDKQTLKYKLKASGRKF